MFRTLSIANKYALSRVFTHKPFFLTHSVTSKCNCKCKICDVWRKKPKADEMSTREIFRMLNEAKKLNFVSYIVFGGEPLMRSDLLDILRYSHDMGLYTSIITNGTYLPENAEKIAGMVDLTWVSLDHNSEYHDEMRGQKEVFEKAVEGIVKLKHAGGRVAINCVLSRLNMDAVEKMAKLARRLGVKLAFDPMEVLPGSNEEHVLTTSECARLFSEIRIFKERGYPILNSYSFIDNFTTRTRYSCVQPRVFLRVSEDGKVVPFWCQKTNEFLGDLRKQSLSEMLRSPSFRAFVETTKGCNICGNSSTVESSIFYSASYFLKNLPRLNNPYLKFILDYALS